MLADTFPAFVITATVLTMVPGLDTAMVLRSASMEGVRHGAFTALGIAIGCLCWGAGAAFGLGALLEAWPLAFEGLRLAGALYLAWLGMRLLFKPRHAFTSEQSVAGVVSAGARDAVRLGFTTNILNPKVGLFYLTLLPQFVPQDRGGPYALTLACVHVAIAFTWFVALAMLTGGIRPWLRRPSVVIALDRITGALFVLLGLQLSLSAGLHA
jgi:threonine/homoserine/homoserine lactone efflux protein